MAQKYSSIYRLTVAALGFSLMAIAPSWKAVSAQTNANPLLQEAGVLEEGDTVLKEDGSLYDIYTFEGRANQSVTITVESLDFDTYLLLADSEGEILGESDDLSEENTNSSLAVTLPRDGTYNVIVNGYEAKDRGNYTLTIR
jgi:Bacterial pre-peptidase C-terminal domain